jgi:hypothetical protein
MDKLVIAGRTNWEGGFYIKFKAVEKSMKVIKKIVEKMDDEFFVDNQAIPKTLSKYDKWKDQWIPISTKKFGAEIVCGDKMIHIIFYKFPSYESVNKILDKYCIWAEPRYKKGFGPEGKLK